jgi:hypothetical protein
MKKKPVCDCPSPKRSDCVEGCKCPCHMEDDLTAKLIEMYYDRKKGVNDTPLDTLGDEDDKQ